MEDVFIRLWEKHPDFDNHKNTKAVLYISVKNASLSYIKKRRNNRINQEALSYLLKKESEDFILNEITRAEVLREIYTEMQKLPPECKKVMNLYFQKGLDHKSIADQLGVTVSTVKNQKARGIMLLKKKFGSSLLHLSIIAMIFDETSFHG